MTRWKNVYQKCSSIRAMLKMSYVAIIVIMAIPTVILLFTMLSMTSQYDRLIENIDRAAGLSDVVNTKLTGELWDIVAGKKDFSAGNQYKYVRQIETELNNLVTLSENADKMQYIVAAQRATSTLESYIDKLNEQIQNEAAVSYNESIYQEIKSVSGLTSSVLQQYINEEIVSISLLNKKIQSTAMTVTILVIIILLVITSFAKHSFLAVKNAIHNPILSLTEMTGSIAKGDLTVRAKTPNVDELQQLTESLNSMAGRLQQLINERVEVHQMLQKFEMRALQAQITPHFVYNTFETIIWLAEENRNREVIDITLAFTDFFRISLSRGQDFITVEKEAQHVKSYLAIQSVRYGSIMTYSIDIDAELYQIKLLKLLLQPLVENSIYHGIKGKRSRGHIQVEGHKNNDETMTFSVSDDGLGMKPERLTLVRNRLSLITPPEDIGFGLFNVHKRIRLYYGGNGLQIESEYKKGTKISFTIPCK